MRLWPLLFTRLRCNDVAILYGMRFELAIYVHLSFIMHALIGMADLNIECMMLV